MITNPIFLRAARQMIGQRFKSYKPVPIKGTYNDMPQPCGAWDTHYNAQQRKYNLYLLAGIGMTIISVIVLKENVFFNYSMPDCPADKNDYGRKN